MQLTIYPEPGRDFTGSELVLTEQRPRMRLRPEVAPLQQGDTVVFAVHRRPVQGSRLRSGHRHSAGVIFHDTT